MEDPATRVAAEAAVVHVQNGTLTPGLAQKTAEYLQARGVQIGGYGNADRSDYAQSMILVYTGKRYTAEAIAGWLNLPRRLLWRTRRLREGWIFWSFWGRITGCRRRERRFPAATPP